MVLLRDLALADGTGPSVRLGVAVWIATGSDFVLIHGDPLSDPAACWRVWSVYQAGSRIA